MNESKDLARAAQLGALMAYESVEAIALAEAATQALEDAALALEARMSEGGPTSYGEEMYEAGYADAIAHLLMRAAVMRGDSE